MTEPAAQNQPPQYLRSWWMPALMIGGGIAFFIAVAADLRFEGKLVQADRVIAPFLHQHSNPWLIILASGISRTGGADIAIGIALIAAFFLWRKKFRREVVLLALGLVGSGFLNGNLKAYFAIPRPVRDTYFHFKPSDGLYTFPSGHTMCAAVTAGLLALILCRVKALPLSKRLLLAAAVGCWTLLVAASLVYVGVHYLTDVLAALGVSLAWIGALRAFLPPRVYHHALPPPIKEPS